MISWISTDISHLGDGDVDQKIILQGADLTTLGANDQAIIQSLLDSQKLIVDG